MPPVTALVTGGTGFVGSRLVRALLARGGSVRVVSSGSGSRDRVADIVSRIDWYAPTDEGLDAATRGVTHFFHLAVAYDRPEISDDTITGINVNLPLRVLDRLQSLGTGATCILGDTFFRKFPPKATRQVRYTRSKADLAQLVTERTQWPGLRIALLQIEQVYGPGDADTKVLPHVTRQMLAHTPRIALTDGNQRRDFVHVDDVVAAASTISDSDWSGFQVVECGTGTGTPVREVFTQLHRLAKSRSVLGFGDLPADQTIDASVADIRWLHSRGWKTRVPLSQGLAQLVADVAAREEIAP